LPYFSKMNTKLVMLASALVMAGVGLACTFLPHEILSAFGQADAAVPAVALQLLGALYLGFAMLNWMAKAVLIGGIYARPLAMGNFLHFFVGAMALVKAVSALPHPSLGWALTAAYVVFAVLFGLICFRHPLKPNP